MREYTSIKISSKSLPLTHWSTVRQTHRSNLDNDSVHHIKKLVWRDIIFKSMLTSPYLRPYKIDH